MANWWPTSPRPVALLYITPKMAKIRHLTLRPTYICISDSSTTVQGGMNPGLLWQHSTVLSATSRPTKQRERTVAFPSQQWLRERAMMLPYTYITYVVSLHSRPREGSWTARCYWAVGFSDVGNASAVFRSRAFETRLLNEPLTR